MSSSRLFPVQLILWSVLLAAVAAVSVYLAYELVVAPRRALQNQIREQKETIAKLEQDKQRLEAYLKILKHIDRRARVEVLRQANDQQGNLQTTIRFTETDDTGKPISASRELTLPGQEVYFDTLVIKFDDHFVEQGDPLKGQALMLFRRIFSSTMRAEDGFVIDKDGLVPEIYAGRQTPSGFEKDLWKRFWDLANDEKLAKERGVRAIHGDAPYMRLEPDRVYEICLRSTGEVVITPGTRLAPSANDSEVQGMIRLATSDGKSSGTPGFVASPGEGARLIYRNYQVRVVSPSRENGVQTPIHQLAMTEGRIFRPIMSLDRYLQRRTGCEQRAGGPDLNF